MKRAELKMKARKRKAKLRGSHQKILETGCYVCKESCVDAKAPKVICRISSGRVTRSYTKLMNDLNDEFIIIEAYRCMPLLGDEDKVPFWDIHIVRYCIIFKRNIAYFGYCSK